MKNKKSEKDYISKVEEAILKVTNTEETAYMFVSQENNGLVSCIMNGDNAMIAEAIFCTIMTADNDDARARLFNVITDVVLNIISTDTPLSDNIKGRILNYLCTVNNKDAN